MKPISFNWQNGGGYGNANEGLAVSEDHTGPLSRSQVAAVATFSTPAIGDIREDDQASDKAKATNSVKVEVNNSLFGDGTNNFVGGAAMQVRRLSVRECERLQGFPDDWTQVPYRGKPAADGPRYKALGNSMACNAMQWLGERIALVDELMAATDEASDAV